MLGKIICWPLNGGKNHINNTLVTAKKWPRPLNRGGRWIEVSNTTVYWQINRDFETWLFNGGWPLNRGRSVIVSLKVRINSTETIFEKRSFTQLTCREWIKWKTLYCCSASAVERPRTWWLFFLLLTLVNGLKKIVWRALANQNQGIVFSADRPQKWIIGWLWVDGSCRISRVFLSLLRLRFI